MGVQIGPPVETALERYVASVGGEERVLAKAPVQAWRGGKIKRFQMLQDIHMASPALPPDTPQN